MFEDGCLCRLVLTSGNAMLLLTCSLMTAALIVGVLVVAGGGVISGSAVWPIKLMKRYQFEHWWLVAMITSLVAVPWTVTLVFCPNFTQAFAGMPWKPILCANLWSAGWGVANVACGICYVRIGVALTAAILTGMGLSTGAILPMIIKGSGIFQHAPNLTSPAGLVVLFGVGVLLAATIFAGLAGIGRERALGKGESRKAGGSFVNGLIMAVLAGILSSGMGLSFVYGQDVVVAALKREGAGDISATYAVWAVCLIGGAIPSIAFPVWLLAKRKSWAVFATSFREFGLAALIGISASAAVALLGSGMLLLGALGASVGLGIQQATWMLGGQIVGFASGEWQGVDDLARRRIHWAIVLLIVAMAVLTYGNTLVKS